MLNCVLCLRHRLGHGLSRLFCCSGTLNSNVFKVNNKLSSLCMQDQILSRITAKYLSSEDKASTKALNSQRTFTEIFRFPGIRIGFFLHKLKWYQTLAVSVAVPSTVLLNLAGAIDSSWILSTFIPGALLTSNLYGFASLFHYAVGFMYISEDETVLKVSYLDFWGNRIDEEYSVNDVMPFLDAPRPPTDFLYKQIFFYSSEKVKPKLFIKLGKISDSEKFLKVFGPIE